jgi:hypothetical protein
MKTAVEMRDEAARMRAFALGVTDAEVLLEINAMIDEWEARAGQLEMGVPAGGEDVT